MNIEECANDINLDAFGVSVKTAAIFVGWCRSYVVNLSLSMQLRNRKGQRMHTWGNTRGNDMGPNINVFASGAL